MKIETYQKAKKLISEQRQLEELLNTIAKHGFKIQSNLIVSEFEPGAEKRIGQAIVNGIKLEIADIEKKFEEL